MIGEKYVLRRVIELTQSRFVDDLLEGTASLRCNRHTLTQFSFVDAQLSRSQNKLNEETVSQGIFQREQDRSR